MMFKRLSGKKWLLGIAAATAVYGGLWFVTESLGVPQVRIAAVRAIEQPVLNADSSELSEGFMTGPVYRCSAGAYGPFVVRADYSWENGATGESGHTLYLWIPGRTFRLHDVRHGV
ncbi:MAG: hypothetical protein AB9869_22415 [Verrucomicrobiia bacterium]